jgi:hypothetical protein
MKMETAANDDVPVKEIFPELTRDVIDRMKNAGNPRLREVLALVVRHVHAIVREAEINALRVTAIAAGPFATVQALIPIAQLGVLIIVGASLTDYRNRQHDSGYNKRCMPKVTVHLIPNPGISV